MNERLDRATEAKLWRFRKSVAFITEIAARRD